ncbi:hypothetical protein ACFVQ9_35895 [Streptomyces goshikiensis]|uniref:hypothetical protein n=1 Tax=Streptomyces goshikiensis TaxID=1942 RepID=UPI0036C02F36
MSELRYLAALLRGSLPHLVDEGELDDGEAQRLESELGRLLAGGPAAESTDADLQEVLRSSPAVVDWVAAVLAHPDGVPPEAAELAEDKAGPYEGLAGDAPGVGAQRYTCPVAGDVHWFRLRLSATVPNCGTHHVPLELVTT